MAFSAFMSGAFGRGLRIVAGLVLIVLGVRMHTTVGTIVAIVGLVPLVAGTFNWCLLAPLFGGSVRGGSNRSGKV